MPAASSWTALTLQLTLRALASPRLAIDLLRLTWAFRRRGWWKTLPFLPLPEPGYMRWRMYTAYGREDAIPPTVDVIRFAQWRRETMHL
jgi:hypothetical protein